MRRVINKKLLNKIEQAISLKNSISDVKEFEELANSSLFENPPELWDELERAICNFIERKNIEIFEEIKKILLKDLVSGE